MDSNSNWKQTCEVRDIHHMRKDRYADMHIEKHKNKKYNGLITKLIRLLSLHVDVDIMSQVA